MEPNPENKKIPEEITLNDLVLVKSIPSNKKHTKVYLVKSQASNKVFILKSIFFKHDDENIVKRQVKNEFNTLLVANNPFLIGGFRSFKDATKIYLLIEYFMSIKIYQGLKEIGIMSPTQAKFYVAQIILGLEFLHHFKILHRDLKPNSILIGEDGYIKLTNFDNSIELKESQGYRTYTMIGTPHYMAPEVIEGKGYSFACDFWGLGVLTYEFLCGKLPFGHDLVDPIEVFEAVKKQRLRFPAYVSNANKALHRSFVKELLVKTPEKRLGNEGVLKVKAHEWLEYFNWVIYQRRSPLLD